MTVWRRQRRRIWIALAAVVVVPLATLVSSRPASAIPGGLPVTIMVTSSMNPSTFDQGVMYTATLTTSDANSIDPADTVDFQDNGNDINACNGQLLTGTGTAGMFQATCSESSSNMSVGAHNIMVLFGGDSTYASGSGSLTQNVNQAPTNTVITSPAPGSSVSYGNEGQSSLSVMVSGPPGVDQSPSGSVNLYSGVPGPDTFLCTAFIGGRGRRSIEWILLSQQRPIECRPLFAHCRVRRGFQLLGLPLCVAGLHRRPGQHADAGLSGSRVRLLRSRKRQLLHRRWRGG